MLKEQTNMWKIVTVIVVIATVVCLPMLLTAGIHSLTLPTLAMSGGMVWGIPLLLMAAFLAWKKWLFLAAFFAIISLGMIGLFGQETKNTALNTIEETSEAIKTKVSEISTPTPKVERFVDPLCKDSEGKELPQCYTMTVTGEPSMIPLPERTCLGRYPSGVTKTADSTYGDDYRLLSSKSGQPVKVALFFIPQGETILGATCPRN
jgi:hypothetical protein